MAGPSPSKHCWNEETLLGQGKVYSPAHLLQHCLGGWGKRGEIKADHVNCPKSFVPHCRLKMGIRVTDVLTTSVEANCHLQSHLTLKMASAQVVECQWPTTVILSTPESPK